MPSLKNESRFEELTQPYIIMTPVGRHLEDGHSYGLMTARAPTGMLAVYVRREPSGIISAI